MIKEFSDVRTWGKIRGVDGADFQTQYQRCLQEVVEIHDAYNKNDQEEVKDAIGDTIVTLINLAKTIDENAEDCLAQAFDVIKLRKGITTPNGDFVRYAKLSPEDQALCDEKQGNAGSQYFKEEDIDSLSVENFSK